MDKSQPKFPSLSMAHYRCASGDHMHCVFGMKSDLEPDPGYQVWVEESTGNFFYPFEEFILCLN